MTAIPRHRKVIERMLASSPQRSSRFSRASIRPAFPRLSQAACVAPWPVLLFKGLALLLALLAGGVPASGWALTPEQAQALLRTVDDRQRNNGDSKAHVFMEQKERDKLDVVYELVSYRRSSDQKLMLLFLKPKSEQGKGYLRTEKNLWMYEPSVGRWERRTEREKIAGTGSRRQDFDESRLAEEYTAQHEGEEKLGAYTVHKLKLTAREGVDVAFPMMRVWIDVASGNLLMSQEYSASGKLMRTSYYSKWQKVFSESKKADVWYAQDIRFFDELDKSNSTTLKVTSLDLKPLDENLFTKAWLESKSR